MKRRVFGTYRTALAGAAAALIALPAIAQERDELEEIVVTASKRTERLLDVPAAIQTLDGDAIENLGIRGFDDYAGLIPNISQRSFGAPGSGTVIIRGLNTGPQQTTSTAGFYLDDTPFTAAGSLSVASVILPDADLADVERIEVLKGPQGTLYGASSLGGLVRIISRKPDLTEFGGAASVSASTVDGGSSGFGVRATLNMPLSEDRFGLRLTGFHRQEPGFTDNIGTGTSNVNEATVSGGRVAFLAAFNEDVELQVNGLFQNIEADGFAFQDNRSATLLPLFRVRQHSMFYDAASELEIRSFGATLNWDVGPGTFTATAGQNRYTTATETDYTPIYGPLLGGFGLPMGAGLPGLLEPESRKDSAELRYASKRIGNFEFLAGVFYTDEDNLYPIQIDGVFAATRQPLPSVFADIITSVTDSTYEEQAVFGNATLYFNDAWDLTLGARYSENEQTSAISRSGLLVGIFGSPVVSRFALDDDSTTYLATLRWRPSENVSTFLRAASGYRPGGPQTNAAAPTGSGYQADEVTNYEAGIKATLLDRRLDLAASVYRIDWDDIQLNTLVNGFLFITNGGAARVNGLELELAGRATDAFTWGLNLGYNDTELTEIGALEAAQLGATVGDALPLSSKWNGSALADYRFRLAERLGASVGATLKYAGDRPSSFSRNTLNNNVELPSDTVLDLRAGFDFGNFSTQFRIENATDENGISSFVTNKVVAVIPVASNVSVIRPRTYSLSVGVKF